MLCCCRKHTLNCHRMRPALFQVLCEIKEKTGKQCILYVHFVVQIYQFLLVVVSGTVGMIFVLYLSMYLIFIVRLCKLLFVLLLVSYQSGSCYRYVQCLKKPGLCCKKLHFFQQYEVAYASQSYRDWLLVIHMPAAACVHVTFILTLSNKFELCICVTDYSICIVHH